ncbi:TetR/AcrR family transcriptional regulator [Luteimicrobium subarcticum]|uniref:TetR family transcriptional regulator n=1 Tax=Luteimicrobium subarcticum TaxID=620910 RepID=A0A2M8W1Q3_9MICO|nr:TetR/AcrR family transcriptional regulator [Luteimicrobium subarcticum]PJI84838.1 TetR family transcriptional regulator [Luteimicrobium subarcticum]
MATATQPSARERLLAAADELFYAEGIHVVGIDRIIERAGVAKASLYTTFGSKDALVGAYLDLRHDRSRARIEAAVARQTAPRARLLALYDAQAELFAQPTFRGCAFVNASAESDAGDAADERTRAHRDWLRTYLTGLAREAGATDPDELARQLVVIYDGANLSYRLDGNPAATELSRRSGAALVDAMVPPARAGGASSA